MDLRAAFVLLSSLLLAAPSGTQAQAPEEASRPGAFLDALTSDWIMTGQVRGDSVRYDANARWVLGGQFLRLRMTDVNDPPQYAAHVYVGYDSTAQHYVAHWLDTTGPGASTTLGTGDRNGDALTLRFDYPDGPFRTTFEWRAEATWRVRMQSQSESGTWQPFADYTMRSQ